MDAGMGASEAMWGSLTVGATLFDPPVTTRMRTTTSPMTTIAPPTRTPTRIRFARSSAARLSAARAWLSALRWAFDLL